MLSARKGIKAVTNVNEPEAWPELTAAQRQVFYDISVDNPEAEAYIMDLTEDERKEWHTKIVSTIFEMANQRKRDHVEAFHDCVQKFADTRILDASKWSHWGGSGGTRDKLRAMNKLANHYGRLYILPAPTLVAFTAIRQFRNIETNGRDDASMLIKNLRQMDFISLAIQNYTRSSKFISTDMVYHMDPSVPQPQPPKQRQRKVGNTETATSNDELDSTEEPDDTAGEDADADEQSTRFNTQIEQSEPGKPLSLAQRRMKQIKVGEERAMTRDEAWQAIGSLVLQTLRVKDNPSLNEQLEKSLDEPTVIVLSPDQKAMLEAWAEHNEKTDVLGWIDKATEDKAEHTWMQVTRRDELEHVDTLLDSFTSKFDKLIQAIPQPESWSLDKKIQRVWEAAQDMHDYMRQNSLPGSKTGGEIKGQTTPIPTESGDQPAAFGNVRRELQNQSAEIRDLKRAFQQAFQQTTIGLPAQRTRARRSASTRRSSHVQRESLDEESEFGSEYVQDSDWEDGFN